MKTLFIKMMVPFEWLSGPAGEWFQKSSAPKKRTRRQEGFANLSPECSNVRGSRKEALRKTPAP
jgi:hypothetical protein